MKLTLRQVVLDDWNDAPYEHNAGSRMSRGVTGRDLLKALGACPQGIREREKFHTVRETWDAHSSVYSAPSKRWAIYLLRDLMTGFRRHSEFRARLAVIVLSRFSVPETYRWSDWEPIVMASLEFLAKERGTYVRMTRKRGRIK